MGDERQPTGNVSRGQAWLQLQGCVRPREDILDRSLINVTTARLVSASEVELFRDEDGTWRVAGIDPTFRPRLWRLLPRRFRGHDSEHRQFVSWTDLEPFVGHVPTSRLKLAARRLARLHPAQIADLVEAASHEEGEGERLAEKIFHLRVFGDDAGKMNRSLTDAGGEILVVPQFTLYGDVRKGRRPSWIAAAPPEVAEERVEAFCRALEALGARVARGAFREHMAVELVNDGPVTILLEVP